MQKEEEVKSSSNFSEMKKSQRRESNPQPPHYEGVGVAESANSKWFASNSLQPFAAGTYRLQEWYRVPIEVPNYGREPRKESERQTPIQTEAKRIESISLESRLGVATMNPPWVYVGIGAIAAAYPVAILKLKSDGDEPAKKPDRSIEIPRQLTGVTTPAPWDQLEELG